MKIIVNKWIPFKGYRFLTIWGIVFTRDKNLKYDKKVENHERIHVRQRQEMVVVGLILSLLTIFMGVNWWSLLYLFLGINLFYILYFLEFIFRGFSYDDISFEREAYYYEEDYTYLSKRKHFHNYRFFFKKYLEK